MRTLLIFLLTATPLYAKERLNLSGWMVYWDKSDGESFARQHSKALSQVSVFAYHFNLEGSLIPADPWVGTATQGWGKTPVFLTLVNDVVGIKPAKIKDPTVIHNHLATDESINRHISEIVALSHNVTGIEIDYENVLATDREQFSRFIEFLAVELHARNKLLSVIVQPKSSEVTWNGAGALDFRAIGKHADKVVLMAYYFRYSGTDPGPSAPPEWLETVTRFALSQIPAEKLIVALSLTGFDWTNGKSARMIAYEDAIALAQTSDVHIRHQRGTNTPHFSYLEGGQKHEVWYEDVKSIATKVRLLKSLGVTNVSIWRFGQGDPKMWSLLLKN